MATAPSTDVVTVARNAGFTGVHLVEAVSVALAESTGDASEITHDSNGTADYGLWQINSVHTEYNTSQLLDPAYNAAAAFKLSKGGTDWSAWTTFHNQRAQAEIPAAVALINKSGSGDNLSVGKGGTTVTGAGFDWNPFNWPGDVAGGVGGVIGGTTDALGGISSAVNRLLSPTFWLRVGEWIAGAALVVLGLVLVFKRDIVQDAKGIAKVAAV
jgi:hypothetical protein